MFSALFSHKIPDSARARQAVLCRNQSREAMRDSIRPRKSESVKKQRLPAAGAAGREEPPFLQVNGKTRKGEIAEIR